MNEVTYRTQVRRKRGKWHISVPDLPADAPVIVTQQLGNAAPQLIFELAEYLGVNVATVSVDVQHPRRPKRPPLRERVTASAVQLSGGVMALAGVYLAAGAAVTLITAGIAGAALSALRESGRI